METPPAVLYLTPMNGTFERKTITVPFYPDVLRIGRQTNNKTLPTPQNGYFDSKVLSRQHAEIWADRNGKVFIRDVKSSNGTFVNGQRLSQENKDSDPHELREQDMLELGIDIVSEDQKTVVHHKVAARVEHAGFYGANNVLDLNFGDLDPQATAGLMGGALGQGAGQMRRSGSQSSIGSNGRMSVVNPSQANLVNAQQRQQHFWLTPVNMDKIIQKLHVSRYHNLKRKQLTSAVGIPSGTTTIPGSATVCSIHRLCTHHRGIAAKEGQEFANRKVESALVDEGEPQSPLLGPTGATPRCPTPGEARCCPQRIWLWDLNVPGIFFEPQ